MKRPKVIDKEVFFDDGVIISESDLKGVITYANRNFSKMSGYSKEELIGQPHSILRHPDMPKQVFKNMWDTLNAGQEWSGLVKNLRKDGYYYWTKAYIQPTYDKNGKKKGYQSARKIPKRDEVYSAMQQYKIMKELEKDES